MDQLLDGNKLGFSEDVHNEFRMHTRILITEISHSQSKQDKDGSIRRTLQPISKTICSFLNTDGGMIFIGVDDDRNVNGVEMSKNMIDHFFGQVRVMCEKFKPHNPINKLKITVLRVKHNIVDGKEKVVLRKARLEKNAEELQGKLEYHELGGIHCQCNLDPAHLKKKYMLIINVQAPNPMERTIIYQNEEGLAYRRRLASNKCVYLDDLRRMVHERKHVFVDLHDEIRHEIDQFINLGSVS